MDQRILVINPNSNAEVTANIDRALAGFRFADGPAIDCVTLADGPPAIESQADVDAVAPPLRQRVAAEDGAAAAFVVACFSDPGLYAAREATAAPVFGIAQCGFAVAQTLGERFGIIAILDASIPRHRRYVAALGLGGRFAGDRAIGLGVAELAQGNTVLERMAEVGGTLIDRDGADVLVLGCAGMAQHRGALEARLGVPVVDPTQAAVGLAIARLRAVSP